MLFSVVYPLAQVGPRFRRHRFVIGAHWKKSDSLQFLRVSFLVPELSKVISMPDRKGATTGVTGVRDRRYAIRFPFAADVELIDLESGQHVEGVTSDISHGGCFVCTSKPLPVHARARLKLSRKGQSLEALVVVRIVKPRVGMGIEFFDLEPPNNEILNVWMQALSRERS